MLCPIGSKHGTRPRINCNAYDPELPRGGARMFLWLATTLMFAPAAAARNPVTYPGVGKTRRVAEARLHEVEIGWVVARLLRSLPSRVMNYGTCPFKIVRSIAASMLPPEMMHTTVPEPA